MSGRQTRAAAAASITHRHLNRGDKTGSRVGRDAGTRTRTADGRGCGSRRRRRVASATAWLVVSATSCLLRTPAPFWRGVRVVQAFAPSPVGRARSQHRRGAAVPKSHIGATTTANVRGAHLFGAAGSADMQGAINTTMMHDGSLDQETDPTLEDETVLANLRPSISAMPSTTRRGMRPATRPSSSALLPLDTPPEEATTSWKTNLVDLSNLASLLCVLDCTLLPLVSIALPALSWGLGAFGGAATAAAPAGGGNAVAAALAVALSYLPAASHAMALYFVVPVGLLTAAVNYCFGHRRVRFGLLSLAGVAVIYAANSSASVGIPAIDGWLASGGIAVARHGSQAHGSHVHDACGAVAGAAAGLRAHACPEGWAHRATNTLGCALLLGSNYASKKYMEDRSRGCAASALAEAWDGDGGGGGRALCPPGCNCAPGTSTASSSGTGGDVFFQWGRTPGDDSRGSSGGRAFTRFRR